MSGVSALISDLAVILICASLVTILFKWLKQPVVLGYIVAGILAGPACDFTPTVTATESIKVWADIGVIFLPNTSFSQNVGLVTMTKVVNRYAFTMGAIFLIIAGFCPKLAAIVNVMPQSVLGGAAVMMFSSIVVSGMTLVNKAGITTRTTTIFSLALGLGYGLGTSSAVLDYLPEAVSTIFGGSGIVPAAIIAILLNIILPKEKTE